MDNRKANEIIDIYQEVKKEIDDFDIKFDEENNTLNITTLRKQVVEYINVNFTITPTGVEFK